MNFEDLQSMAQQAYNEKIEYERQAIDRKAKVELENLKKAIDLINSKAIFKKEKREGSYVDNFVLANAEIQKLVKSLREDYHRATQRLEDFHRYMYSLPEIKSMVAVWREAQEEKE